MGDRGHVFRRAFSWLPTQFASQSDAPVGAPRQFGSTEHLSVEAIAAFVDGELRMNAHLRAAHHLSLCPECAAEVDGQGMDKQDRRYLETLIGVFEGGPTGVDALGATMNLPADTLSDEIEPYLLREQYIVRTPRGRLATERAYLHLGRTPRPAGDDNQPLLFG